MTVREILIGAKELITENWVLCRMGYSPEVRQYLNPNDPRACAWCATGAVFKAFGPDAPDDAYNSQMMPSEIHNALKALTDTIPGGIIGSVIGYNDSFKDRDSYAPKPAPQPILDWFDRAIGSCV